MSGATEDDGQRIQLEVAAPFAMFSRPDTGSTPISYPVPTSGAARGMFEAVLRWRSVFIRPLFVEVCKPICFERFVTNYGGPLRKPAQIKDDNNYQLVATVLADVRYRITAKVHVKRSSRGRDDSRLRRLPEQRRLEHACEFAAEFNKRLESGQNFYTPCLGWKEFVPSYFGPWHKETARDESVNLIIPSMLDSVWENSQVQPSFRQNCQIERGRMSYVARDQSHAE